MTKKTEYAHFFVDKSYREILEDNEYNAKIEDFITLINAQIGRQSFLDTLSQNFEAAYWLCGSLSHDFRKLALTPYHGIVNSLSVHDDPRFRSISENPEEMDTLHAIVYLMLKHDTKCKRPDDALAAISCIKDKMMASETVRFAMEDKNKYEYNHSISISRNWKDCEIKEKMRGESMAPHNVAERIIFFASCFDEQDKECMINRAFSAAIDVVSEEGCVSYLDEYDDINEYKEAVRAYLLEKLDTGGLMRNEIQTEEEEGQSAEFVGEEKAVKKKGGRKPEPLFSDKNTTTQEQANIFVCFLKKHNQSNKEIDTTVGNYINRAFAAFYRKWMKENIVPKNPNGNACYRFLKEECKLAFKVDVKTYGDFIRKMITRNTDLDDVTCAIEIFNMT